LLPDLIRGFSSSSQVEIRNPRSTRPWQHALDPLFGYLRTLDAVLRNKSSSAYNFGPIEKSLSVGSVADIAKNCWKLPVEVRNLSLVENSTQEANSLDLDPSLAIRELNWHPAWSQVEAVVSTINWWQELIMSDADALELCKRDLNEFLTRNKLT
jgi:CDP-glucose 4,6-dehydratase